MNSSTPSWIYQSQNKDTPSVDTALGDLLAYGCSLPDKTALLDHKTQFSFFELETLATSVALYLAETYPLKPGQVVMVLTQKDCQVPIIAIALWKLGLIYAPFDGDAPTERILSVLATLEPTLIVDFIDDRRGKAELTAPYLSISELMKHSKSCIDTVSLPAYPYYKNDVVYIIHTSGSTGRPKGVQITESNLKHYFASHNTILQFDETAKVFSLTPFHFDVSIEDTLLPLSVGATVFQYRRLHQSALMLNTLIQQDVTHLIAVSTILTMLSEDKSRICQENFPSLSMVMTGAEVCAPNIINLWKSQLSKTRVINAYGPTEVTIVATCYSVDDIEENRATAYPIGKPLAGVEVLILDDNDQLVEPGKSGELCLGGPQVMLGYRNNPQENDKRLFIRDDIRFYRTGDICFWDENQQIQFQGRNDDEVKINGRRIHLGEIQQQCMAIAGIERATVGLKQLDGQPRIVAILVTQEAEKIDQLRAHLVKNLPTYMIPFLWGWCKNVSLSASGKSNDKKLLEQVTSAYHERKKTTIQLDSSL